MSAGANTRKACYIFAARRGLIGKSIHTAYRAELLHVNCRVEGLHKSDMSISPPCARALLYCANNRFYGLCLCRRYRVIVSPELPQKAAAPPPTAAASGPCSFAKASARARKVVLRV